jgi:hypothetical protein
MKKFLLVTHVVIFLSLAQIAGAQTALSLAPENCVVRAGDDLRWAAPMLDESGWQRASQWTGDTTIEPHFWLRCRLSSGELAPAVKPALQVAANAAYEVFINGQLLARSGNAETGAHTVGVVNQYSSAAFSRTAPVSLALRITYTPTLYGQQPLPWILFGDAGLLHDKYSAQVLENVRSRWIIWLCNVIMAAAGLFFLTLYLFDRTQRVLLFASICWLDLALLRFIEFLVTASVHFPSRMEFTCYVIGDTVQIFYIAFFFALAGRRINALFRILMGINISISVLLMIATFLPLRESMAWRYWIDLSPQVSSFVTPLYVVLAFAPLAAFWPINKLARTQLVLYCVCSFWMGTDVLYMGAQIPWLHFSEFFFLTFQTVRSIAIAAVVVAMTLLLIQRIRSTNRERAALSTEMRAAQEIQRILVPHNIDTAPQIRAEAVFLPAQHVGGDFYRCRVLADGSQWLLLGDVSGKGTAAGMTGAMLLGACEGHEQNAPAEVLRHLNQVLCASGVGGLATCLCAHIAPDGLFTIANAGHLPPYRNGKDMEVEGGLPLGLVPFASYDEARVQLEPADVLVFLSDGVVEAQSATGELFGFQRTREIATHAVQQIAEAAQRFGQQDDITVLSMAFEPAAALTPRK